MKQPKRVWLNMLPSLINFRARLLFVFVKMVKIGVQVLCHYHATSCNALYLPIHFVDYAPFRIVLRGKNKVYASVALKTISGIVD